MGKKIGEESYDRMQQSQMNIAGLCSGQQLCVLGATHSPVLWVQTICNLRFLQRSRRLYCQLDEICRYENILPA
jgi:hypothetical protein